MELSTIEKALQCTDSIKHADQIIDHLMSSLKISTYAFTYYTHHPKSINKLKYERSSTNLTDWHNHYIEENYHEVDSTLSECYDSVLPLYWDIKTQVENATSEREKQMRIDSLNYGVTKGMCIPIHGAHDDFAVFLATQRKNEHWLDENNSTLHYELFYVAHCYYTAIRRLILSQNINTQNTYNLSSRELNCLKLIAERYSVKEISQKLFITERTVQFHIQNLNKKLGTKNKYQSVAKALEKEIISQ